MATKKKTETETTTTAAIEALTHRAQQVTLRAAEVDDAGKRPGFVVKRSADVSAVALAVQVGTVERKGDRVLPTELGIQVAEALAS